jgi:hypothetical protein
MSVLPSLYTPTLVALESAFVTSIRNLTKPRGSMHRYVSAKTVKRFNSQQFVRCSNG